MLTIAGRSIGGSYPAPVARPDGSVGKRAASALESLAPGERGEVLDQLSAERPDLAVDAQGVAVEVLSSVSGEQAMSAAHR